MADWLSAADLQFSYGKRRVLSALSFRFPERGIVLCTGPSGCGKSTLGLLLSGHLRPERGSVEIEGSRLERPGRAAIAVSQDDDLFPWMKMGAQLEFVRAFPGTIPDWRPLAGQLGILDAVDLYPGEMSGGMRKRLALLRATLLKPRLLVLDETLGSIEPELRERILTEFRGLWSGHGIGVLLISHDVTPRIRSLCSGELALSMAGAR